MAQILLAPEVLHPANDPGLTHWVAGRFMPQWIALAIITGAGALGNSINAKFKAVGTTLNSSGS
ncbi:hypothetical protein FJ970_25450 [Mesorhizobium sp. B2-1-8]|uniref:Flp family type IVb pilin n=1 Tax=unclassified Mesorhizobium TaxID=325217 RepID=UPI001CCE0F8E|nr:MULTISPECIES: hypothetical protein [unclassified Mesorhizobium]MBZ9673736.1 hypothetical protein [Mesorhizobium sp. ES1-3]UCI18388.1 hypothetical protein FJ970_25450 [Mesorhizobium sp. B2-1-8]